jgi:hypothetical protein
MASTRPSLPGGREGASGASRTLPRHYLQGTTARSKAPASVRVGPLLRGWRAQAAPASWAFVSTVTTFATAVEVAASELSIESFLPADERTAEPL